MVQDARFEDGDDLPLNLQALDKDDLQVISALTQDAVFPAAEMQWDRSARRFAILINRFRWEQQATTAPERVQAVLVISDVVNVASQGVERSDKDLILSMLEISFAPGDDGTGRLEITLAGDGALAIDVEALEVTLKDVTRAYVAPSRKVPQHP
ncbi:MAG: DUF2948 family protein [Marinosulfonomonas sp.]|nr:DUF2948 family protein [Marinosulfonomonas sp.]